MCVPAPLIPGNRRAAKRLSTFFEVTNATNKPNNPCCIDYDIDEDDDGKLILDRTVEYCLPIIPAIGLFWAF